MSFTAKLTLNATASGTLQDGKFNVIACNWNANIDIDKWGRPVSRRIFGVIYLTIETVPDVVLIHQMFSHNDEAAGDIVFLNRDEISTMMKYKFDNARVVGISNNFTGDGIIPMTTNLTISAERITIESGGKAFEDSNDWSVESKYD
jgi:hypothetical protein